MTSLPQTLGNDALQPSLLQFAVEAVTNGPSSNDANKKRSRQSQNGIVKIEDVHCSLDNIKQIENAIGAVVNYLEKTSVGTSNKPAVEVLTWSIVELSKERKWIAQKVNCSKEKKQSQQAHAKITKEQRQQAAHLTAISKASFSTPRKELKAAWDLAKRLISRHPMTEIDTSNALSVTLPRQKKPCTQNNAPSVDKSTTIRLPRPANPSDLMYTPREAVEVYLHADENKENLCGTKNKNELRSYMKRYKNEMIKKYLPIKETRFNDLLKKHAGEGKPLAPLYWNDRGRPVIARICDLADVHDAHQSTRFGRGWERGDTKSFLFETKKQKAIEKGIDPTSVKQPDRLTVNSYHSGLMSMPGKKIAMSKPKPLHRDMGETSQRMLLSNIVGTLMLRTHILRQNQIPAEYVFDESKSLPGVKLARDLVAAAWECPVNLVQFTPYQLVSNVDDKACIYSGHQGDGTGDGMDEESGFVIVNEGVMSKGYDIHDSRDNTKNFNGLKVRYTNLLFSGGNLGSLWIQMLGFTAEELPNAENGR